MGVNFSDDMCIISGFNKLFYWMNRGKGKVKYGILCPSTNLFYEIPDEETYRALIEELKEKKQSRSPAIAEQPTPEIYA